MKPNPNDVLRGRGVPTQNHPGNKYFRKVVASRRVQYALMTKIEDKDAIANQVLIAIQSQKPPGRFLEPTGNGEYHLLNRVFAMKKIKQALRENPEKKNTSFESKPSAKSNQRGEQMSDTSTSGSKPSARPISRNNNRNSQPQTKKSEKDQKSSGNRDE
jgi:hypothetical protein